MPRKPLQLRDLLKKLRNHGIEVLRKRGKGSEIILLKPNEPGSRKGPQYPVKNHGMSTEISIPVINKILERFEIPDNDFWD